MSANMTAQDPFTQCLEEFQSVLLLRHFCEHYDEALLKDSAWKAGNKIIGAFLKTKEAKMGVNITQVLSMKLHAEFKELTKEYVTKNQNYKKEYEVFMQEKVDTLRNYFREILEVKVLLNPEMDLKSVEETKSLAMWFFEGFFKNGNPAAFEEYRRKMGEKLDEVQEEIRKKNPHLKWKLSEEDQMRVFREMEENLRKLERQLNWQKEKMNQFVASPSFQEWRKTLEERQPQKNDHAERTISVNGEPGSSAANGNESEREEHSAAVAQAVVVESCQSNDNADGEVQSSSEAAAAIGLEIPEEQNVPEGMEGTAVVPVPETSQNNEEIQNSSAVVGSENLEGQNEMESMGVSSNEMRTLVEAFQNNDSGSDDVQNSFSAIASDILAMENENELKEIMDDSQIMALCGPMKSVAVATPPDNDGALDEAQTEDGGVKEQGVFLETGNLPDVVIEEVNEEVGVKRSPLQDLAEASSTSKRMRFVSQEEEVDDVGEGQNDAQPVVVNEGKTDAPSALHLLFLVETTDYQRRHSLQVFLDSKADFGAVSRDGYIPLVQWIKFGVGNLFQILNEFKDSLPITPEIASDALTTLVEEMGEWRTYKWLHSDYGLSDLSQFIIFLIQKREARLDWLKLKVDEDQWQLKKWNELEENVLTKDVFEELQTTGRINWNGKLNSIKAGVLGKLDFHSKCDGRSVPIEILMVCLLNCKNYLGFREVCKLVLKDSLLPTPYASPAAAV